MESEVKAVNGKVTNGVANGKPKTPKRAKAKAKAKKLPVDAGALQAAEKGGRAWQGDILRWLYNPCAKKDPIYYLIFTYNIHSS